MATRYLRLGLVCAVCGPLSALVGCAAETATGPLPPPNFSGPVVSTARPVRPAPVAVAKPQASKPTATRAPAAAMNLAALAGVPRDWIPGVQSRPWKYIVIHHSATDKGGAAKFDREHKQKGWDELGYHFVIGNGTETGNGQIEVGPRWPKQKWGAHTKTADNRFNDYGIGVCLVGNFDETRPSKAQVEATARLVAYLMKTYRIPAANIYGHGECKPTDCPGKNFSIATVKQMATRLLADAGESIEPDPVALEGTELLRDVAAQ